MPFDFNMEHVLGENVGLVDYISRQPNQEATKSFKQKWLGIFGCNNYPPF